MGKGSGLPRSQVRTRADKVKGSWAWQASSRPSAEVECHSWGSEPFTLPHCAGWRGAPRKQGSVLPGTRGTGVDKAGKGEEVSATCPLAYAAKQFPFASFAWSAASSGWAIGITVQFTPLSGHLCEKDNFG